MKRRRGFTLTEILISISILVLLIGMLVPAVMQAREAVRRMRCGENLSGIGKALHAYAAESDGQWPNLWNDADSDNYYDANSSEQIDTLGSLWVLVLFEYVTPEGFICPSDEHAEIYNGELKVDDPFPRIAPFDYLSISYSYQVPHSLIGSPKNESADIGITRFAVMADRSPFDSDWDEDGSTDGKLISAATGYSAPADGDAARAFVSGLDADERKEINSPIHYGDGQNVLFRDGHVEWCHTPLVGIDYDNIYTRQNTTETNLVHRVVGVSVNNTDTPRNNRDSYLRTWRDVP